MTLFPLSDPGEPLAFPASGEVYEADRRFASNLAAYDSRAFRTLVASYKTVFADYEAQAKALSDEIRAARKAGTPVSASWLFQRDRYKAMAQKALAAMGQYAAIAGYTVRENQTAAINAQEEYFRKLASGQSSMGLGASTWQSLPSREIQAFVGASRAGPLRELLDDLARSGNDVNLNAERILLRHISMGSSPARTAQALRNNVRGMALTRAMTITRTETARAQRSAALAEMRQNSRVVDSWIWRAAGDERTCIACMANSGREYPLTETLLGHVNCRCVMIPHRSKGANPKVPTGEQMLTTMGRDAWPRVMGPGRAAWLRRQVRGGKSLGEALQRMATLHPNPRWGGAYRPTTLRSLRGRPTRPTGTPGAGGGPSSVPVPRPPLGRNLQRKGEQALDDVARQFAGSHGMTEQQYKDALEAHVRRELASAELSMRRSVRSSVAIAQDRRFKSQFETGTSGGALSGRYRADAEYNMFTYPKGAGTTHAEINKAFPGAQRPVYGYAINPNAGYNYDGAVGYGEVRWVMKDSVRGKATFTSGDSLGERYAPGHVLPGPEPHNGAQAVATGSSSWMGASDPLPGPNGRGFRVGDNGYTEVQYHNGLFLDDVAKVILPSRSSRARGTEMDDLKQALTDAGVPWEVSGKGPSGI